MDPLCYAVGTRVRLKRAFGAFASGAEGVVIGYYRRNPPAYAIRLGRTAVVIPPEYVEAVDRDETGQTI